MGPCGVRRRVVSQSHAVALGRRIGALAALSLAVSGCSSGHHVTAPTSTSSAPPSSAATTTSTLDPTKAAILDAYRAAWADFVTIAGTFPVRPLDPRLTQHEDGRELTHDEQSLTLLSAKGHYTKGGIDLAPVVTSVVGDTATVMDCFFDHSVEVDARTGNPITTPDVGRTKDRFTMTRVSGVWYVSDSTILDPGTKRDACTPGG
jgi:hypothetical protein